MVDFVNYDRGMEGHPQEGAGGGAGPESGPSEASEPGSLSSTGRPTRSRGTGARRAQVGRREAHREGVANRERRSHETRRRVLEAECMTHLVAHGGHLAVYLAEREQVEPALLGRSL